MTRGHPCASYLLDHQELMSTLLVDSCVVIDCFHRDSPNREGSLRLIEHLFAVNQRITMPAHGWFEVWCTLNRLSDIDRKYLPPVFAGQMQLEGESGKPPSRRGPR